MSSEPVPDPAAITRQMRELALTMSTADLEFAPTATLPDVFGFVMDTTISNQLVTLVAFVDGTTSLYFGSGGGVVGAGDHKSVRRASLALLSRAQLDLAQLIPATTFPAPQPGMVSFYARTYAAVRGASAPEGLLVKGPHALAPLFRAAQGVISAIRESSGQ